MDFTLEDTLLLTTDDDLLEETRLEEGLLLEEGTLLEEGKST